MIMTDVPEGDDADPSPPAFAPEEAEPVDKPAKSGGSRGCLKEVGIVVVAAMVLSVVIRTFLVQAFYVPSESMENTLMPNDRIVASKITTRIVGVKRGEAVVFKDPGGWLPPVRTNANPVRTVLEFIGLLPSSSGDDLVKRVIGVGGDRVMCCDARGQIVLNGVSLVEPFIKPGAGTDQVKFDVVVPEGSIFVMGDNRSESADSRFHMKDNSGGVPVEDVVGRVVLKVWPINELSTVGIPQVFDDPALDNQPGKP